MRSYRKAANLFNLISDTGLSFAVFRMNSARNVLDTAFSNFPTLCLKQVREPFVLVDRWREPFTGPVLLPDAVSTAWTTSTSFANIRVAPRNELESSLHSVNCMSCLGSVRIATDAAALPCLQGHPLAYT